MRHSGPLIHSCLHRSRGASFVSAAGQRTRPPPALSGRDYNGGPTSGTSTPEYLSVLKTKHKRSVCRAWLQNFASISADFRVVDCC
ncbi:hypothetical protein E2C01_068852 [Portunus trituberculatus]|uniref:Uncharacterized protein n=1 Tax=Portunus trituberculatus TaxID=210409 RepID=A0A5B7HT40_PORTR|nr:hypothetical protein [Portunus trituberculatus]